MPDFGAGYSMNPQTARGMASRQQDAQSAAGKVSAEDAKYVDTAGNCASCSKFQGDGKPCAVVADPVASGGWCTLYQAGQPQTDQNQDADAGAESADTEQVSAPAVGGQSQQ